MQVRCCFHRSQRLLRPKQYKRVIAEDLRIIGVGFIILIWANSNFEARLGLSISKRYCPRAVDRNRLKRIARESFRIHAKQLPQVDIIILSTRNAIRFSNRDLFKSLGQSWKVIMGMSWAES